MPTGGEYVATLKKLFPDPVAATPQDIYVLLNALQKETDTIREKIVLQLSLEAPVPTPGLTQLWSDIKAWQSLLNYYKITTGKAIGDGVGPVDPQGLPIFYKRVTGPLVDGQCYLPPSCNEAALLQHTPLAIAPRATVPFQIAAALEAGDEAAAENFRRLMEDVAIEIGKPLEFVIDVASDSILKPLAYAAGAVLGLATLFWLSGRPKKAA